MDNQSSSLNIAAVIPARGNSKGIPRKNVRPIAGLPLVAHSILDCRESQLVDRAFVSTDDLEIKQVAEQYGATVIQRPAAIAGDNASSESALIHALKEIEARYFQPDLIVFLQCTSPVRSGDDIDQAIHQLQTTDADSLLSVSPSHRFLWQAKEGEVVSINYDYRQRQRRQDLAPQYVENGSIYIFKPWVLKTLKNRLGGKISLFCMDEKAAWEIDSLLDWKILELLLTSDN
ncbi:Cytidylyltransferase, putative [Synechococcus sp. PCC 7335]|uniref:acylneuraminate cytidylyltransferase family protein n=1 Tax=Synechococcus sp. (strain ATCC 29403 / PCC 7335) TaxID=91464 RepID=UPI00017EC3D6|nr:acylneuraminate cytidylyltransferase family protein [Synechococcus sp. PCC 7335]EDX86143.1 Cytidylyltransferase, putative [Synechococcus sp. PCC 7335]